MNIYGLRAQEIWTAHSPKSVSQIENQEEFFTELGEQITYMVVQISQEMQATLPQGLPFWERVGQMNMIKCQAEEIALHT